MTQTSPFRATPREAQPAPDQAPSQAPEQAQTQAPAQAQTQAQTQAPSRSPARAAPEAPPAVVYPAGAIPSEHALPAQVVGLYSFPKSGNTWLRAIIASITGIPQGPGMMQRYVTDSHYGPVIENPWEFQDRDWYFYKSHRKHVLTEHQHQGFDTDRVVYVHRHPLDVFMSYLNFVSQNVSPRAGQSLPVQFDRVEDLDADALETLFAIWLEHATLFPQNRAFGSVFEHAALFRDRAAGIPRTPETEARAAATAKAAAEAPASGEHASEAPETPPPPATLVMRYEDLQDDFEVEVRRLCDFLGFRGIDVASVFDMADSRTRQNGKFFWKRQKDNYRNFLTDGQVARFHDRWGDEMAALGYGA